MFSPIQFFLFDSWDFLLSIIIDLIYYGLVITFSRKLKTNNTIRRKIVYALIVGFVSWLGYLLFCLDIDLAYSTSFVDVYFQINFIFCFIGAYLALAVSQKKLDTVSNYLLVTMLVSACIIAANMLGFYLLYYDYVDIHPGLLTITVLLTIMMTASMLRFLIQMSHVDYSHLISKWKYIGTAIGGATLAGIPYITLISMIDASVTDMINSPSTYIHYFVPFIYVIAMNLLFLFVPDLFGERLMLRHIQSYLSLFNQNPDAVFFVNLEGKVLYANEYALNMTGHSQETIANQPISSFLPYDETKIQQYFETFLQGVEKEFEASIRHRDGFYVDAKITVARIIVNEEIIGLYGIVRDITEKKQAEKTIEYLAYHDDLTSLPNKRKFERSVKEAIELNDPFMIMYLDFDRFKRINDNFGHFYGDKILQETARKLESLLPTEATIARLGGDEFAVLLTQTENVGAISKQVIQGFQEPILFEGFEFFLTASMGLSKFPGDGQTLDELLRAADIAMYRAKEQGANRYMLYDQSMRKESLNKIKLESDLRKDLAKRKLSVFYQPKFHTETNELVGSEALVRWKHDHQGFIPPGKFIPIAEETNLIIDIERFVITEVFETIQKWKKAGLGVPRTSINISVIHFYQEDFVDFITHHLHNYDIDGSDIEIEITESVIMRGEEQVNQNLVTLRELGIEISVDDFGTGYSSLSYLQKLSVDRLKIDQSFISDYQSNKEIIAAIISMSHNLNLKVIAEGVETLNQIGFLKEMNCFEVQGYFYSPPVDRHQYEKILSLPA